MNILYCSRVSAESHFEVWEKGGLLPQVCTRCAAPVVDTCALAAQCTESTPGVPLQVEDDTNTIMVIPVARPYRSRIHHASRCLVPTP